MSRSRLPLLAQVRLVATTTARDVIRRRATWTTTLLTGLLAAGMLIGSAAISERVRARTEQFTHRVAVDGDLDGAVGFLAGFGPELFELEVSEDARGDVTRQDAAAGMTLPADLDRRIAAGESVEIDTYYRRQHDNSVAALGAVLLTIQELQVQNLGVQAAEAGVAAGPAPVIDRREVALDAATNRVTLAPTIAALAALLCFGVITSAASAAGGRRDDRSIEGLLVLPLGRGPLAAGITAGIAPVAMAQLVVAVAVIVAAMALPVDGLNQSAGAVASILVFAVPAALLLGALASAVGVLAGVLGAGSDDAVSLGDLASVLFVGSAALFFIAPEVAVGPAAWVTPIIGPVALLRDAVSGAAGFLQLAATVLSGAVWCAAAVAATGRLVGREQRILRIS